MQENMWWKDLIIIIVAFHTSFPSARDGHGRNAPRIPCPYMTFSFMPQHTSPPSAPTLTVLLFSLSHLRRPASHLHLLLYSQHLKQPVFIHPMDIIIIVVLKVRFHVYVSHFWFTWWQLVFNMLQSFNIFNSQNLITLKFYIFILLQYWKEAHC